MSRSYEKPAPETRFARCQGPTAPEMLLNFGIWGHGPKQWEQFVDANRLLEHKVREFDGMKCLYAHAYYTEDEFWSIYNRKWYDALRVKYKATHLPNVYDKVKAEPKRVKDSSWVTWLIAIFWSIWPLSGLYGVFHALLRKDYLLHREGWNTRRKVKIHD